LRGSFNNTCNDKTLFFLLTGGLYGYTRVSEYDSLIKVLRDMNNEQKKELVSKVQQLVGSGGIEALTEFIGSQVKRELFVNLVHSFVTSKFVKLFFAFVIVSQTLFILRKSVTPTVVTHLIVKAYS